MHIVEVDVKVVAGIVQLVIVVCSGTVSSLFHFSERNVCLGLRLQMAMTMTLLVKIILILVLHQRSSESSILDDTNVKLSLQYLCPGVDICNRNEPDPNVNHKENDEKDYTSCCHSK